MLIVFDNQAAETELAHVEEQLAERTGKSSPRTLEQAEEILSGE